MRLKREMLLALVRGTLYPDNPARREEVLKKYNKHILPVSRILGFIQNPELGYFLLLE